MDDLWQLGGGGVAVFLPQKSRLPIKETTPRCHPYPSFSVACFDATRPFSHARFDAISHPRSAPPPAWVRPFQHLIIFMAAGPGRCGISPRGSGHFRICRYFWLPAQGDWHLTAWVGAGTKHWVA